MLIAFLIVSVLTMASANRSGKSLRFALNVYCLSYILTTAIGAAIISVDQGGSWWRLSGGGLDTAILSDYSSPLYYFLLFSPLIVCPIGVSFFDRLRLSREPSQLNMLVGRLDADPWSFSILLAVLAGYCLLTMYAKGFLRLDNITGVQGDYTAAILLRARIFGSVGTFFFAQIYVGLPALSHFALFKAFQTRLLVWKFLFVIPAGTTIFLILLTLQKGTLLVYFLSLGLGLLVMERIRFKAAIVLGGVTFLFLNAFQIFILGEWEVLQSLYLILFRMANSFPYYVNLFPRVLPYTGVDLGLDMVGLAPGRSENLQAFNYMFPDIRWTQGAAPAPAHVVAYAQAGIWFSILILLFIAAYLVLLSRLKKNTGNPFGYVLFLQGTVGAYYLTQISIRDFVCSSYGLIWTLFVLGVMAASATIVKYAVRNANSAAL